jgi:hypothetical protein
VSVWSESFRRGRRIASLLCLLIVAGLLVACAEDSGTEDDRQFANDPVVTQEAQTAAPAPTHPVAQVASTPLASPESMLHARGAPETIYATIDGDLVAVDTLLPGTSTTIATLDDINALDFSPSPSGDRVAVLHVSDGYPEVVVYAADGSEVTRWGDLGIAVADGATPEVQSPANAGSINWSTGGNRILVSLGGSSMVSILVGGGASEIAVPDKIGSIVDAAWSPRGDSIAVLARGEDDHGIIWTFYPAIDGDSTKQVVPPNADAAGLGSVVSFAWLPNGSGIAYLIAEEARTDPGGRVYIVDLLSDARTLIAAPGRGGPAAVIVDFAISPDGKSIAYTISVPADGQWTFDSMWVRSLKTANVDSVPVFDIDRAVDLWWADAGIVWQQQVDEEIDVVSKSETGEPVNLVSFSPVDMATPMATPAIGTPESATPVS